MNLIFFLNIPNEIATTSLQGTQLLASELENLKSLQRPVIYIIL